MLMAVSVLPRIPSWRLQALIEYSSGARADVDLNYQRRGRRQTQQYQDQSAKLRCPADCRYSRSIANVKISVTGKGEAIGQIVQQVQYARKSIQEKNDILKVNVNYDADEVAVNDEVKVSVDLSFNPPQPMEAGMVVVDIAVPTGFAAVKESIDKSRCQHRITSNATISPAGRLSSTSRTCFPAIRYPSVSWSKRCIRLKPKAWLLRPIPIISLRLAAESLSQDITVRD